MSNGKGKGKRRAISVALRGLQSVVSRGSLQLAPSPRTVELSWAWSELPSETIIDYRVNVSGSVIAVGTAMQYSFTRVSPFSLTAQAFAYSAAGELAHSNTVTVHG